MRYIIHKDINNFFFTSSNLNLIFLRGEDEETGFIETESDPLIQEGAETLRFSDNDDTKPVRDAKVILPNRMITSVYLAPFNGYAYINSLWLKDLRVRLANDKFRADNITVQNIDIMSDKSKIDLSILGSMMDYDFDLNVSSLDMRSEEEDLMHQEEKGRIYIKNRGKSNLLFRGYRNEK